MLDKREGPHEVVETKVVCSGCKYFVSKTVVFGHRWTKKDYYCQHPDVLSEGNKVFATDNRSRCIASRTEEEPITPDWCPFLKK